VLVFPAGPVTEATTRYEPSGTVAAVTLHWPPVLPSVAAIVCPATVTVTVVPAAASAVPAIVGVVSSV